MADGGAPLSVLQVRGGGGSGEAPDGLEAEEEEVLTGFLWKKGERGLVGAGYKKRFFKLFVERKLIRYFLEEHGLKPVSQGTGFIDLADCRSVLPRFNSDALRRPKITQQLGDEALLDLDERDQAKLTNLPPEKRDLLRRSFTLVLPTRRYLLRASSPAETQTWLEALHRSVALRPTLMLRGAGGQRQRNAHATAPLLDQSPSGQALRRSSGDLPTGTASRRRSSANASSLGAADFLTSSTDGPPRPRGSWIAARGPSVEEIGGVVENEDDDGDVAWLPVRQGPKPRASPTKFFPRYGSDEWKESVGELVMWLEANNYGDVLTEHPQVATVPMFVVKSRPAEDVAVRLHIPIEGAKALERYAKNPSMYRPSMELHALGQRARSRRTNNSRRNSRNDSVNSTGGQTAVSTTQAALLDEQEETYLKTPVREDDKRPAVAAVMGGEETYMRTPVRHYDANDAAGGAPPSGVVGGEDIYMRTPVRQDDTQGEGGAAPSAVVGGEEIYLATPVRQTPPNVAPTRPPPPGPSLGAVGGENIYKNVSDLNRASLDVVESSYGSMPFPVGTPKAIRVPDEPVYGSMPVIPAEPEVTQGGETGFWAPNEYQASVAPTQKNDAKSLSNDMEGSEDDGRRVYHSLSDISLPEENAGDKSSSGDSVAQEEKDGLGAPAEWRSPVTTAQKNGPESRRVYLSRSDLSIYEDEGEKAFGATLEEEDNSVGPSISAQDDAHLPVTISAVNEPKKQAASVDWVEFFADLPVDERILQPLIQNLASSPLQPGDLTHSLLKENGVADAMTRVLILQRKPESLEF